MLPLAHVRSAAWPNVIMLRLLLKQLVVRMPGTWVPSLFQHRILPCLMFYCYGRCEVGQLISEDGQVRFYRGVYHSNSVILKVGLLPSQQCLCCLS